jgi:streptomycin 6-kinase
MNELEKNIIALYAYKGEQWLSNLSELTSKIAKKYKLTHLKPVNNLTYNYVLSGFQGSQSVILKLGLDIDGLKREACALKAFAGFGVVSVFAEDDGMLLLECAVPGESLKTYFPEQDIDAVLITCDCLNRLHQAPIPNDHRFPSIEDWLLALDKDAHIPTHYLQKARKLRDELMATSATPVLLHGDLHHDNIIKNGNDWVVIDPKGVIGEPAFEVAAFIRNPIPQLLIHDDATSIIEKRIAQFSERLKLPASRISDWYFVQAVLAWVWAIEDGCDATYFKKLTTTLDK